MWFKVGLKKKYNIENVYVYQSRDSQYLGEGFCEETGEDRRCLCEPDSEECRGLFSFTNPH